MVTKFGYLGQIKWNVYNNVMTKIIIWWKNDAMVKDLDFQCVGEG
jgi:hypothetical protein